MFHVANCVASINRKSGLEGRLHMRPFHLKENWKFPQSLNNLLPWPETISAHLDWWQNPISVMNGLDHHPKDHNVLIFTDASNVSWGAHLDQNSVKGLWLDKKKKATHKCTRIKGSLFGPETFQNSVPKSNSVDCHRQLRQQTVVAYISKHG